MVDRINNQRFYDYSKVSQQKRETTEAAEFNLNMGKDGVTYEKSQPKKPEKSQELSMEPEEQKGTAGSNGVKVEISSQGYEKSIREKRKVYENVPCALSQNSTGSPKREDNRRVSDTEHVIFTPPDVRIVDMDRATVVTQAGQVLRGVCGRTFIYAGSHGETPFYIEEMP